MNHDAVRQIGRIAARLGAAVVAAILVGFAAGGGYAQGEGSDEASSSSDGAAAPAEENAARGRVLEIKEEGLEATVRRPEGWVNVDSESRAAAAFKATTDKRAQIEVRVSSPIREQKRESFFNSFHSELKSAGFMKVEEPSEKEYGSKTGRETEYEGNTEDGSFRLVVWEFYRDRSAWIIAGFFATDRRDRHYEAFEKVAESLSFERVESE